jgi:hypothetical protein
MDINDGFAILSIKKPTKLFSRANQSVLYKKLLSRWHPDHNGDKDVFNHIVKLYKKLNKDKADCILSLVDVDGESHTFDCLLKRDFELGASYICEDKVIYVIGRDYYDLLDNALKAFRLFRFSSDNMKSEFLGRLPTPLKVIKTKDNFVVVIEKDKELIRLSDYLDVIGVMDARHVAWILSRMLNLCCYLNHIGLSHNAFSVDNVFIHPQDHSISLIGGWFYSALIGDDVKAIPAKTLEYAQSDLKHKKEGSSQTDLELIKAVGKELLGDISGSLLKEPEVPNALINWLKLPCGSSPVEEFSAWNETILQKSFGPKKFIDLNVSFNDVY